MPRYADLRPDQLQALIDRGVPAIQPWGALEWHGSHLPLGLDGTIAEWFSERLCERLDGVLLPTQWNPMTTLPHAFSLDLPTPFFVSLVDQWLGNLEKAGFRRTILVTGHYAQGHMVELYEAALRSLERANVVFVGSPLEPLGRPELLDHAARYETSQFAAIRPDLVALDALPDTIRAKPDAVLGSDPREGSASEGEQLLAEAQDAWLNWLAGGADDLGSHYQRAIASYEGYRTAYFLTSWDQAIRDWWDAK